MKIEHAFGILERIRGLESQKKSLQVQQSELDREINEQKKKLDEFLDEHYKDLERI